MATFRSDPRHLNDSEKEKLSRIVPKAIQYVFSTCDPSVECRAFEQLLAGAMIRGFKFELKFDNDKVKVKVIHGRAEYFSNSETIESYKPYVCRTLINILNDMPAKRLEEFLK
jgi:predicted phosphodiesterase